MKERMATFLSRLIDMDTIIGDGFGYHEANYETSMDEGACGPAQAGDYYYFWNSSNPQSMITAMRSFVMHDMAYQDALDAADEQDDDYRSDDYDLCDVSSD